MQLIGGRCVQLINIYQNMIRQNMQDKKYDEALENLKKLRKCIKRCPSTDFGDKSCIVSGLRFYHNVSSNIYYLKGMIRQSLFHARQACRLYQTKEDIAKNQWALALIYEKINVQKADNIFCKLMLYYNLTKQKECVADIVNNRAYILRKEELAVVSIVLYKELDQTDSVKLKIDNAIETLVNIYIEKNKFKLAEKELEQISNKITRQVLTNLISKRRKQTLNLQIV